MARNGFNSIGRNNGKVVLYAVVLAVVIAMGVVVLQDIKVPAEHISQEVPVTLE
ncbi:MAG: hypothetical protein IJ564_02085 [Alphaproteobacteria bacterium]|nr:hypothetical protein [Alphaproteobacteria bacterium]MBR3662087.1 hypothetical protein [Alphaproteobacteria bacterium]